MPRIMLVAKNQDRIQTLSAQLVSEKFNTVISEKAVSTLGDPQQKNIDLVLVDFYDSRIAAADIAQFREIKESKRLPILAIVSADTISQIESISEIDDFVVEPLEIIELVIRINRTLNKANRLLNKEIINCGALVVDTAKCEVYLEDRLLFLTFKEYELLKFLATNTGRVFTRDVLLNEVWGYEYYGGDRTVDVHVTRLRNKIESTGHVFIETVRNIGYKFKGENKI